MRDPAEHSIERLHERIPRSLLTCCGGPDQPDEVLVGQTTGWRTPLGSPVQTTRRTTTRDP
jgi:hypothetical protein